AGGGGAGGEGGEGVGGGRGGNGGRYAPRLAALVPADRRGLGAERGGIGGHELGRADKAGKTDARISGAAEIKMDATVAVHPSRTNFSLKVLLRDLVICRSHKAMDWQVPTRRSQRRVGGLCLAPLGVSFNFAMASSRRASMAFLPALSIKCRPPSIKS